MKKSPIYIILILALFAYGCSKTDVGPNSETNNSGSNGGIAPTTSSPDTHFIAFQNYTVANKGAYYAESFTVTTTTTFILRFTSIYNSQAAVVAETEFNNFKTMSTFSGFGLFDNQIGTKTVTLAPGKYYVGVRNTSNSSNEYSLELDLVTTLPATDKAKFVDNYVSGVKSFSSGGKLWQPFSVQKGYRYFLDGCNVGGFTVTIIPETELPNFQGNGSFKYYTDYYGSTGGDPGLYEVKLPEGNYYMVASSSGPSAITYTMERWKVN